MSTVQSLMSDISKLSNYHKEQLLNYLEEDLTLNSYATEVTKEVAEGRFSKGKVCPFCGHSKILKHGIFHGKNSDKQRYKCQNSECKKTFTEYILSPAYNSKKNLKQWLLYAKCMINGYSIRKCAAIVGINIATSFFWRHKLLEALTNYIGVGSVSGVVEVDETFFPESFKGNHKNSKNFVMPRKSRKRGKEVKKRGISNEQVCVVCSQDRLGNMITELVCKGRVKHSDLQRLFENRVEDDAIFCTDSHRSYIKFAQNLGIELHQIKSGRHTDGVYHIQHISAFHSNLKGWIQRFKGVATKYLQNYLYWFKWLQMFSDDKDIVKGKNLMVQASTAITEIVIKDLQTKQAKFV